MYYAYLLFSRAFSEIYSGSKIVAPNKVIIKTQSVKSRAGFTLIELLVVLSIMVILVAVLSINLADQRATRDLRIAQNQLGSDIRKTQSYTLSARLLPSGRAAQYYILKFDLNDPAHYTIQGISNSSSEPALEDVETINLPSGVKLTNVSVSRQSNPVTQTIYTNCAIAAFVAPFGKIIFNDGCTPTDSSPSPAVLNASDDYYAKVINFLSNVACDANNGNPPNPTICSASTDSIMTLTLSNGDNTLSNKILINGITGVICPTLDGATCPVTN